MSIYPQEIVGKAKLMQRNDFAFYLEGPTKRVFVSDVV